MTTEAPFSYPTEDVVEAMHQATIAVGDDGDRLLTAHTAARIAQELIDARLAQNTPTAPSAPATRPDSPEAHTGAQGGGSGAIVLDLGDEFGNWIACLGHVDRYEFMVAYAEHIGQDAHVGPYLPPPQHAYMVRFLGAEDTDEVWWQLDPENPDADTIKPVTVMALSDCPALTERRVANPRAGEAS